MGSQLCKGSGVDMETADQPDPRNQPSIFDIDNFFPVQCNLPQRLDWNDELALEYRCKENCRHNHALGKWMRKNPPAESRDRYKQRIKHPLKFAENVEQIIIRSEDPTQDEETM